MNKLFQFRDPAYSLFDFHRHISEIQQFDEDLKTYNIQNFCVMPSIQAGNFKDYHQYIKNAKPLLQKYSKRMISFGFIDFGKSPEENSEILKDFKQQINIKGIKFHPQQKFELKKKYLKPYFDEIQGVVGNVPVYIHMDWPLTVKNGFAPKGKKNTFNKIVSWFPETKFIMGHAGGSGDYLDVWKTCKKYPNVYIETSMAPSTAPLEEVIWKIGPERLLFGSNYPFCSTQVEITKIQCLTKVTEADKKRILNSNGEVFFED